MKYFFILIAFVSCTVEDTGYVESSAITAVDPEITALKIRVTKLEAENVKLKKNDSIYNLKVNSEATKLKNFMYVFSSDSINQWKKINLVYPLVSIFPKDSLKQWQAINSATALIPKVSFLTTRFTGDSVKQWNTIKTVTPLIPKVASLKTDSAKQWVEIKKLQATAPVAQIPVMQADITAIKSKNVSQDKILVANSSAIKNVEDTMKSLIRDVGSDFTLDEKKKLIISKQGIDRIKAALPLP